MKVHENEVFLSLLKTYFGHTKHLISSSTNQVKVPTPISTASKVNGSILFTQYSFITVLTLFIDYVLYNSSFHGLERELVLDSTLGDHLGKGSRLVTSWEGDRLGSGRIAPLLAPNEVAREGG